MDKRVAVIGVGPGSRSALLLGAWERIARADLLVGANRLLALFDDLPCDKIQAVAPEDIARHIFGGPQKNICVLMSGDIGFYSGAKKLYGLLDGLPVETVCGISSLQYLCAGLRIPWQDVHCASLHGQRVNIAAQAGLHPRSFFLTGGENTPQSLCAALAACGMGDAKVTVGSRLSYDDEQVVTDTAERLAARGFDALSAVLVERVSPPRWPFVTGGIPDGLFVRGDVPMTKSEVRCLALAKLRLCCGDTVYDIGAGTGSVAVEMAFAAHSGRVFAVERNAQALSLIRDNRSAFGAYNIEVVQGEAPDALGGLAPPDAAFVGGSGGRLGPILRALLKKNPRLRVAVSAITLETLSEGLRLVKELGFAGVDIAQISVSRATAAGGYHRMTAHNPVYLISGQGDGA